MRSPRADRALRLAAAGVLAASFALLPCSAPAAEGRTASAADDDAAFDRMADAAETIVRATCARAEPRWDAAAGLVVTDATLVIHDVVKGHAGRTLILTEPGGVLPERNVGTLVPHAPRFAPGEQALLFLGRDRAGRLRVVAGDLGQRHVARDPRSGVLRIGDHEWPALRARLAARHASGAR